MNFYHLEMYWNGKVVESVVMNRQLMRHKSLQGKKTYTSQVGSTTIGSISPAYNDTTSVILLPVLTLEWCLCEHYTMATLLWWVTLKQWESKTTMVNTSPINNHSSPPDTLAALTGHAKTQRTQIRPPIHHRLRVFAFFHDDWLEVWARATTHLSLVCHWAHALTFQCNLPWTREILVG